MASVIVIDPRRPEPAALERAASLLRAGAVVGIPTDTIYGLAANALDAAAVERVFVLKGRAADKPLPVLVSGVAQAEGLARKLPASFYRLAGALWPGPVTLIVSAATHLPARLRGGGTTIALRHGQARIANALLATTGFPLTATSANRSGGPEALSAAALAAQLGSSLAWIVDGGPAATAVASTLVDLTGARPRLLREGALPRAAVERALAPETLAAPDS